MDTSEQYYKMCYAAFPEDRGDGMVFKSQDQLQEMLEYPDLGSILRDLREFWQLFPNHRITSMEQLWLAFVMLTLYHKEWYNGEWRLKK